jgi:type I restriction enzyme S subunit
MSKNIVLLKNYISEYSVRNKNDEDIPVYSVTNSTGFCTEYFSKEVASKDKTTYKIVPRGCFAYNPSRINVGSVDWQNAEDRVIVSPLYVVFEVSPKLDQQYLLYYLKSDITLNYIRAYATGSVRDNLKFTTLQEFPINLCSIEEQKEIVSKLDFVDSLITARREQLAKLDELVKSRFIELFESKSWETVRADSIMFNMRNGVSPSNTGKYPAKVLTLSAITQGDFDSSSWKDGMFEAEPPIEKRVTSSDFYMCRGNGNKNLVGAGVYSKENRYDLVFPDTVIAATVDLQRVCLPYLFHSWMRPSVRDQIVAGARTTNGTYKINQGVVSNIELMLPPLELQNVFAAFVEQTDKSKLCGEMEVAA